MLELNQLAPDFTLQDKDGNNITLSNFKGKKVVVYFYPKDNTPGCTKQACAFRDLYDEFNKRGIVVIGISKDSTTSHTKFATDHNLPFILLSDPTLQVINAYGAYGNRTLYGKSFMGVIRCTYVLDETGKVIKVFKKANPATNASDILNAII